MQSVLPFIQPSWTTPSNWARYKTLLQQIHWIHWSTDLCFLLLRIIYSTHPSFRFGRCHLMVARCALFILVYCVLVARKEQFIVWESRFSFANKARNRTLHSLYKRLDPRQYLSICFSKFHRHGRLEEKESRSGKDQQAIHFFRETFIMIQVGNRHFA